jgi:hypothetical protein
MWRAVKEVTKVLAFICFVSIVLCNAITIAMLNNEAEDNERLNQRLIHMVNKHENYVALHHCTLTMLLREHDMIPDGPPMKCEPDLIEEPGYSIFPEMAPVEEPEKRERPAINLTPLEKMNYV